MAECLCFLLQPCFAGTWRMSSDLLLFRAIRCVRIPFKPIGLAAGANDDKILAVDRGAGASPLPVRLPLSSLDQ